MRIGDLNKRISLEYPTNVADGMGGFTVTWAEAFSCYAAVWPVSAKETAQAMAETMTISHRIRIRYRDGIRSSWRLKLGNRYFNIVSIINPNEAGRWLDIMCKEAA
ncbi:MAG: Phage head-tail joining protein [Syntrophorhabdus sp. PtaB.Bin047]|nr:MAG: Phage head-tail joining protein [Syntrophorhabdus sp. PtaB.Bin047]